MNEQIHSLYGTSNEPGISEEVANIRRWAEYDDSFPTLKVPHAERTLAQHLECWSIRDLTWRRLVFLGVRDVNARLKACAARLGCGSDDKPSAETLAYLHHLLMVTYWDVWQERGPETTAYAAAHGFPVMR